MLARASAGIYNRCVVYALPTHPLHLKRAIQTLVLPSLAEAVELAGGHGLPSIRPSRPA
jgi:molybdopterin biosynthesis enzyme MoaB